VQFAERDLETRLALHPNRRSVGTSAWYRTGVAVRSSSVIAELRQNLRRYLRRVENAERSLVTDRSRPIAELGPRGGPAPKH
jgi:hypothetical protein